MYFEDITRISKATSFSFSPENFKGEKGGGTHAKPWEKLNPMIEVKPGETITVAEIDGSGVIESMWFGGEASGFVIRIYWDGQESPSVEAPLGAFFGYGFSQNCTDRSGKFPTLNSAVMLAAPCRGFNCYWQMPFRSHCRITLENRLERDILSTYYSITGKRCEVGEDAAYFHACYRQAYPALSQEEYTIVDGIRGCGHFVGTALFADVVDCNGIRCWVEGEPKMFIDGDVYPSINYTGTEDYFCGSFCFGRDDAKLGYSQQYSGAYSGMYAIMSDFSQRYTSRTKYMLYRWHLPDPIHFEKDFRMTLPNIGDADNGPKRNLASVAYWYQTLPSASLKPLPPEKEIRLY